MENQIQQPPMGNRPQQSNMQHSNTEQPQQSSQNKTWYKKWWVLLIIILGLTIAYFSFSFQRILQAQPELGNMQKVAEQFLEGIKNHDINAIDDLLSNELQKSAIEAAIFKVLDDRGGVEAYEISSKGVEIKGNKTYGNFSRQILTGNKKFLSFNISVVKEDGKYKIAHSNISENYQEENSIKP